LLLVQKKKKKKDGDDFQQHLQGKDECEDIVGEGEEGPLNGIWRDQRPLHGQSDTIETDEEEDDVIEPRFGHQLGALPSDPISFTNF